MRYLYFLISSFAVLCPSFLEASPITTQQDAAEKKEICRRSMQTQQTDLILHTWPKDLETKHPPFFLVDDRFFLLGTTHTIPPQFLGGSVAKLLVNAPSIHVESAKTPSDKDTELYCREFVPTDLAANLQHVKPDILQGIDLQKYSADEGWVLKKTHYEIAYYFIHRTDEEEDVGMDNFLTTYGDAHQKLAILETDEEKWRALGATAHAIKNNRPSGAVITDVFDDEDEMGPCTFENIKEWSSDPLGLNEFKPLPDSVLDLSMLPRNLKFFRTICLQMELVLDAAWPPFLVTCGAHHLLGSDGLLNMCQQHVNTFLSSLRPSPINGQVQPARGKLSTIKQFDPATQTFIDIEQPCILGIGQPIPVKEIKELVKEAYVGDEVEFIERILES